MYRFKRYYSVHWTDWRNNSLPTGPIEVPWVLRGIMGNGMITIFSSSLNCGKYHGFICEMKTNFHICLGNCWCGFFQAFLSDVLLQCSGASVSMRQSWRMCWKITLNRYNFLVIIKDSIHVPRLLSIWRDQLKTYFILNIL